MNRMTQQKPKPNGWRGAILVKSSSWLKLKAKQKLSAIYIASCTRIRRTCRFKKGAYADEQAWMKWESIAEIKRVIVFKITVKDARIEREAAKIAHKDVAQAFRDNANKWMLMPGTKVDVRFVKNKRKVTK
jgi:hypothetical protein